jgi:radical SAM protein with 4Fe4S-binding SPASM domain
MNIATHISLSKLVNIVLVYIGYWLSVICKKVFAWGYPYAVSIETSAVCNLNCPECPTGKNNLGREQGLMTYPDFTQIIDKVEKHAVYLNLSLQGEPFLNKDIFKMIRYANEKNLFTSLSTNGHFLNSTTTAEIINSGLKRLIVSVDGTDQKTYEIYRKGGTLNSVLEGIKILSNQKKENLATYPEIVIQFIVFKHNEHQIDEIKKIGKQIGANKIEIKSAQLDISKNESELLPTTEKYSRYTLSGSELKIKSKLPNRCFRVWETLVITWNGNVVPCCFDKSATYVMGNILKTELSDVWKSLAFNNFRKNILTNRKKTSICCNCTEGLRIKY